MDNFNQQPASAQQPVVDQQPAQQPMQPAAVLPQASSKNPNISFILIILVFIAVIMGGVYLLGARNINQSSLPVSIPTISQNPSGNSTSEPKTYMQSSGRKELVSEKFKFKLSYPDNWSYYPDQQYIETSFILFPEFNGTMVEIDVSETSDFEQQNFDTQPLAHSNSLNPGYSTSDYLSTTALKAKTFEGVASKDYLSGNNLHGDYNVKIVQFLGNEFTYVVTTTYFVGPGTDLFLVDFNNLLVSFVTLN